MKNKLLNSENSILLIIDIQEKLLKAQHDKEKIQKNAVILTKAAKILGIPVIVSEQYPQGLGATIPEIKENLSENAKYYEKKSFSCCANSAFEDLIKETGKNQVIVCGIESHVCVHQTVSDLLSAGYEIFLVKDAVGSRKEYECEIGFERMISSGAVPACVEMIVFELIKCASHEKFKQIQELIK
ncbi:MAG: hydrolase [bacterium]